MIICAQHSKEIHDQLNMWGLSYLAPTDRREHFRRARASWHGSKRVEDFDPLSKALHSLERLLEGQFSYDDDEDEDRCVVCDFNAVHLIGLAVNSTVCRFHKLRGPVN